VNGDIVVKLVTTNKASRDETADVERGSKTKATEVIYQKCILKINLDVLLVVLPLWQNEVNSSKVKVVTSVT